MDNQRLSIADIGKMREQAELFDKHTAGLTTALYPEGKDRTRSLWQQFRRQVFVRVIVAFGPCDPINAVMPAEKFHDLSGVGNVALHANVQGFDTLQYVEGVGRAECRAEIAQAFGPRTHDKSGWAKFLGEIEAVISFVGLRQRRELVGCLPIEIAGVDDRAGNRRTMPPRNLVAECMTISTPCSKGRQR